MLLDFFIGVDTNNNRQQNTTSVVPWGRQLSASKTFNFKKKIKHNP